MLMAVRSALPLLVTVTMQVILCPGSICPVSSIVFVMLSDGLDTVDVTLPDVAGADGVELPVGEQVAMFVIVAPVAPSLTVPEIVNTPVEPTVKPNPVH